MAVIHADAQLVIQFVGDGSAVGLNIVEILHILGLRHGLAVDIDNAVLDLQGLARQAQTTLHVVVATVNGAVNDVAKDLLVVTHHVAATLLAQGVVIGIGALQGHGVACREVKHHNIHALHVAQTLQALVFQLGMLDVGLAVEERQGVLRQREVQRRLRHARAVGHLVHPQEVACQQ